jgi:hypothetical protein
VNPSKWILFLVLSMAARAVPVYSQDRLAVGLFSRQQAFGPLPQGWEPLVFKGIERHTRYWLGNVDGLVVLRARSEAAASGLERRMAVDLSRWPRLQWRWRVNQAVSGENLSSKAGDDYAARVYVNFAFQPEKAGFWERQMHALGTRRYGRPPPGSAITYIWSAGAPRGTTAPSPYTDKVKMLVLRGRSDRLGRWFTETRDVAADYRHLFGAPPPPVIGVGLMCDTDNTGSRAAADFGDIVWLGNGH